MIYYARSESESKGERELLTSFSYIGVFLVVAILFPIGGLAASFFLRPKKPNPIKQATYECGLETTGESWVRYNVRYYLYALVFVVFDVETVFLYPWAVQFKQLGIFAFFEMLVFVAILVVGLAYAWKKKALEWK